MMERIDFFHLQINAGKIIEFLSLLDENIIAKNKTMQVTGVNPYTFMLAKKDRELAASINKSDLVNIDGISLVWGLRLFGHKVPERVACPDVFFKLLEMAQLKKYSVYFLGTSPGEIIVLVEKVKNKYPLIHIAGYHHGYFRSADEAHIVKEIRSSGADLLFVGMPSPQKEIFIGKNKLAMQVAVCFGVGGVFDILTGKTKRAPVFMQKICLEWLYRFWQEPRKMICRDFKTIDFLFFLIKEKLKTLLQRS